MEKRIASVFHKVTSANLASPYGVEAENEQLYRLKMLATLGGQRGGWGGKLALIEKVGRGSGGGLKIS